MKPYLAIFQSRMSIFFQYRTAMFAGICTQLFWGFIKVMIFKAFYENALTSSISLQQTITFIWISQALFFLIPWNVDKELEEQIKSGNIAYELCKPLNLYWLFFSRTLALRIVPTLIKGIPLVLLLTIFSSWPMPISLPAALLFFVSLIFSFLLSAAITTFIITTFFWTISGDGIQKLLPHFITLFSGAIIPLPLFPNRIQPFLNWQPFRGIIDIPSRLYTGIIPLNQALSFISFQCIWIVLIVLFGKLLLKKAMKNFVIQGG